MFTTGKKKDTVVCWQEIGSFFVVAGNFHYDRKKKKIHYDRKKKRYSRLSDGCTVLVITTRKKRYSRLSGEVCCCISLWFWQEISIFFVVAGNFDYVRKKKKIQSSVGGKLAVFLLWREIFITTGKKNIHYDRKKKKIQSSV